MWRAVVLCCVLCAFIVASGFAQDQETWTVNTPQGPVRGYKSPSFNVFSFMNVPYATVPPGPNRFKAPLPPPERNGIFDAIDRGIICMQDNQLMNTFPSNLTMVEDCLVANIHVPNIPSRQNLPVLVSVHGGAYLLGWGALTPSLAFVNSTEIIFITFNYRVGLHGFLCLGTEDAPGNAGMKDQVALLRWVKSNIAEFGGNPNDIVISGCSAGGASVDTLKLSPMTNGLFKRAIVNSGCSINPFSTQLNPLQNAKNYAFMRGFTNVEDVDALSEFYKTTPLDDLIRDSLPTAKNSYFVFQPCVERDIGQERFLEEAPINILKSGNFTPYPTVYGYAHHEGMFRLPEFSEWSSEMNGNFSNFLPADLEFENYQKKEEVASKVKTFYFGDNEVDETMILEYVDYFSDVMFLNGMLRAVTLQAKANNTVYLYDYKFTHNGSSVIPYTNGLRGADHCDQIPISLSAITPEMSADEAKMILIVREILYNFIITGDPTPPGSNSSWPLWKPAGADRSPHYSVGSTIELAGVPNENRSLFWDEIYEQYLAIPQPPPKTNAATLESIFSYKLMIMLCGIIVMNQL